MDWMFYLILLFVLFGFVAVISIVRYVMNRRLEKLEREAQMEKEARQIAESNSGL
jgi:flagellar biosynthesis/type III secretory pathway M-ring protein FliF/YscJ